MQLGRHCSAVCNQAVQHYITSHHNTTERTGRHGTLSNANGLQIHRHCTQHCSLHLTHTGTRKCTSACYFIWCVSCTVVVSTSFVMCVCVSVCVCVCECMWGCLDNCVGVLVIYVLLHTVFCDVCTVFLYCFVYVYLFLFLLSVLL